MSTLKDYIKRQRAIDREEYFQKPGSTAADWLGGKKQITVDRKKQKNKKACRGRFKE